jgi:acetyltransferase-like isoleucine patch superfamily enzyme
MQYRNLSLSFNLINRKIHFLLGKRNLLYAYWWGVKIGKKVKFDGKCHFERFPGTSISIGNNCEFRSRLNSNLIGINHPCSISTIISEFQSSIEIGDNCGFSGTVISAFKCIKIGNNVRCGANTLITDSDWHLDDLRSGAPADVTICDKVWLGVNSVVLKGVMIGENTIIGANSVVTKSIPANVVAAGNPCRIIKDLNVTK